MGSCPRAKLPQRIPGERYNRLQATPYSLRCDFRQQRRRSVWLLEN